MLIRAEIEIYNLELDDIIVTSQPWDDEEDGVQKDYSIPRL